MNNTIKHLQNMHYQALMVHLDEVYRPARENAKFTAREVKYTPPALMEKMFKEMMLTDNKTLDTSIAVLYTIEMAVYLRWLKFKNITIIIAEEDDAIRSVCSAYAFEYVVAPLGKELLMEFDVVCGNVPFNDSSSTRTDGTTRRQGGRIIAKEFISDFGALATQNVGIISSVSKLWSGASKKRNLREWQENGLCKVWDVSSDFHGKVDSSLNIGCFFFDKTTTVPVVEDEWELDGPLETNLGAYWKGAKGTDRNKIQELITHTPGGKYRVFETAHVVVDTNDKAAFDQIASRPWDDQYRVVFSKIRTDKIGLVVIAAPGDKMSGTASCLVCNDYRHAQAMKLHLESPNIVKRAMEIKDRTSDYNSKFLFERLADLNAASK